MTKVTSKRTMHFPKLNWAIVKGDEKELPEDKEAQAAILAHWAISEVTGNKEKEQTEQKPGKDKVSEGKKETEKKG